MTTPQREDSLKIRYAAKLFANGLGLVFGAVTQSITVRTLGPEAFGSYSFLMNFFNQVWGFFDMGTSMGFYTIISQRPGETAVIRFYWIYALGVGVVMSTLVGVAYAVGVNERLWFGHDPLFVWVALGLALFFAFSQILNQMIDGYGLTVAGEMARNKQRVIALGLLSLLAVTGNLTLKNYFLYNYLIVGILGWFWCQSFARRGGPVVYGTPLSGKNVLNYTKEFFGYASPLAVYCFAGAVVNLFDRWLLQLASGSVEQGFFGFAFQLSSLAFVFSGSMTPLLTRELALAYAEGDRERMRSLFSRSVKTLYSATAVIVLFLAVAAPEVSRIFGGHQFNGATWAFGFMMLYPLYQTIGQLSGSVFFATGQTRAYRNLGTGILVVGLPISYCLLAPGFRGGMHLGAAGLALKMVGLQIIGVNLLLRFIAKSLALSYRDLLWHQVVVTVGFGLAAVSSIFLGRLMSNTDVIRCVGTAAIYGLLVVISVWRYPGFLGMKPCDLKTLLERVKHWTRRKLFR